MQNSNKVAPPVAKSQGAGSDGREGTTNKVPRPGRPPSPPVSDPAPIVTSNPFSALAGLACEDEKAATSVVTLFNRNTRAGKGKRGASRSPSPSVRKNPRRSKKPEAPAIAIANLVAEPEVGRLETGETEEASVQPALLTGEREGEGEEECLPVVSEGARVPSSTTESGGSPPPRRSPVTLGDKPMEDPGVGLSFTYEVPRSVRDLLSTDRENTKGNDSPLETFHTPRTQPIVPVVSTKRKRAMGDSNDRSIRRKLILRDESGKETSLEGSLEIPSSAGSPALSPIVTEQAPEEISKIPNLDGYRDTLDVSGFLPHGQTSPEQSRENPTIYYSLGGTDLLDPQNSFMSRANGEWNMSGFPNGSIILAPSDTLENAGEKEAPSIAPVSLVKLVTEASEGEIPLIYPLDSHNSSLGELSINSSQDELQLVGSTSVDGALPDTTSLPIKARASTQVNSVPELFVKHHSGLTDAEKRKNWSLSVENSTETLILGDSMVCRITTLSHTKMLKFMFFPGGRIQHPTQVLQNYRRKDCTKLKNVIIMLGPNDVLQRKGTVLNSFIGQDMQDCLLLAKRKFGGAKIHYTGIYKHTCRWPYVRT